MLRTLDLGLLHAADPLGSLGLGGDWIFEDCRGMHDTSDGIDLLHHSKGGTITVRRTRSEGNAGNQLKTCGNAHVENSVLVGNCAHFNGKSFTYYVDNCRAAGNTVALAATPGTKVTLINNTIYGQGDVLMEWGTREGFTCNGTEQLRAVNNIFLGDVQFGGPSTELTAFTWTDNSCSGLKLDSDYNLIHGVKGSCPSGGGKNDICRDPQLGPLSGDAYGMVPKQSSPAIDSGKGVGGEVPNQDFSLAKRPFGKGVDRGAFELH